MDGFGEALHSDDRKSFNCKREATHRESLAHALPTQCGQDPDLALILGMWDKLPDEVKRRMIELLPIE